jgi:hypothetical protein
MSRESGFHLASGELTVTGPAEQLIADGRQSTSASRQLCSAAPTSML